MRSYQAVLLMSLLMTIFLYGESYSQEPGQPPAESESAEPQPETIPEDPLTTPQINFNLRNADLDAISKFITDKTGKPVIREKSVNARLTISTPEEIPPFRALDLIYDSLLLQGFAVLETEELVRIVPADQVSKYELSTFTGELPAEVSRMPSRIIQRIFQLQNIQAQVIQTQLEELLGTHASIVVDQRTNKVMITDTVANIQRYSAIIGEFDVVGFDTMEVQIVQLEHADAYELSMILRDTLVRASQAGRRGQEQGVELPTEIRADTRTNSLVVAAPTERMNTITEYIRRLDVPKEKDVEVYVVPVEYADANNLAGAISSLFRRNRGRADKDTIEVRTTGRDNTLLILASEENYQTIKEVIEILDTEAALEKETRRFELKHLDAEETASELETLYGSVSAGQRDYWYYRFRQDEETVTFVPMTRTNSILAIGPPEEFELIEELIAEIDQPIDIDEALPKIYRLQYTLASEIEEVLNEVFGLQEDNNNNRPWWWGGQDQEDEDMVGRLTGKIKFYADDNTNSIIAITNNASNYEVVDQMIERLDKLIPELANTMIIQLQHADARRLANNLNILFGKVPRPEGRNQSNNNNNNNENNQNNMEEEEDLPWSYWWGGEDRAADENPISNLIEQVRFVPDARTNSLLVISAARNFEIVRGYVEELDRREPQVLIKVRIIEVNTGGDKRTGVRWTPDQSTYSPEDLNNAVRVLQGLDFVDTFGGSLNSAGTGTITSDGLQGRTLSSNYDGSRGVISSTVNLDLLVQLLIENMEAEVVISPTLYVSNNESGRIFVGENIPRLSSSQLTSEGTRNDSFANEDIGIDMQIVPNISSTGSVVLNVQLSTAQTTGETRFGSDILQKREYNTKVSVENGQTMVLGGIRLTTDQQTIRKFPILGSIPILGELFKNRSAQESVTDLYAFITPEIIESGEQADDAYNEINDVIQRRREELRIYQKRMKEMEKNNEE